MEYPTRIIPFELSDGSTVRVEATLIGEQQIAFQKRSFQDAMTNIKAIVTEISENLQEVRKAAKPQKISIKLGLEVAVESGQVTTLIVKGSGKANLEVTLEWSN